MSDVRDSPDTASQLEDVAHGDPKRIGQLFEIMPSLIGVIFEPAYKWAARQVVQSLNAVED
jgi:hypothetical protein